MKSGRTFVYKNRINTVSLPQLGKCINFFYFSSRQLHLCQSSRIHFPMSVPLSQVHSIFFHPRYKKLSRLIPPEREIGAKLVKCQANPDLFLSSSMHDSYGYTVRLKKLHTIKTTKTTTGTKAKTKAKHDRTKLCE